MSDKITSLSEKTIADFGDQWTRYTDNDGFYGEVGILEDTFGPLLALSALKGLRVAEIGSGTGRIVRMLLEAGAGSVMAVEPSAAFAALEANTQEFGDRVTRLNVTGDRIPAGSDLDLIVSIGVIHHIPDPLPVLQAARRALRPGGRMLVWVYGQEGNSGAVRVIQGLRHVTTRLPHGALNVICHGLNLGLDAYMAACRLPVPLPFKAYIQSVIGKFPRDKRRLVIYDQLKPAYAKYYSGDEAVALLKDAGFSDVTPYHRHGYSWTVMGVNA